MDVVATWTGADAEALRTAYRMSGEAFAEKLGVGVRTVRGWKSDPTMIITLINEESLDTLLAQAPEPVRERFLLLTNRQSSSNQTATQAITVSIAVVRRADDVLLVRRRTNDMGGLTWQFPAGVVKPGEDKANTAVQETYSETGIHCEVQGHLGGRVHPITGVYCDYFDCEFLTGTLDNRDPIENAGVEWVPRDAITRFIPADRIYPPILERLMEDHEVTDNESTPPIAAAVITSHGRVLLARRRVSEGSLAWQFPAGAVEDGESAKQAAVRETAEEVGLTVAARKSLGQRVHPATGRVMNYVACDLIAGDAHVADPDELAEVAWVTLDELTTYVPNPLYPAVQAHLDEVLSGAVPAGVTQQSGNRAVTEPHRRARAQESAHHRR